MENRINKKFFESIFISIGLIGSMANWIFSNLIVILVKGWGYNLIPFFIVEVFVIYGLLLLFFKLYDKEKKK